ncbi:MAG: glycosyltransferase family 4 protein [Polyangiaceae bacterium]|nr:glycosyltransferase family 4 protein [Polyangiaceae bacterium]
MARIAVVTSSFPERPGDAAGHFVQAEVNHLAKAGHNVTVVAPGQSDSQANAYTVAWLGRIAAFGWPGLATRLKSDPRRIFGIFSFAWRAQQKLTQLGPWDRIIFHWLFPAGALLPFTMSEKPEIVGHGTDVELLLRLPSMFGGAYLEMLKRNRCTLRLVSEAQRERIEHRFRKHELPEIYVKPCALALDAAGKAETRACLELSQARPLIAIVARLVPEKRVEMALRAVSPVPGAQVVVAGEGPLLEPLSSHFPNVRFVGQLPRPLALGLISVADVLVHPSEHEGASSVVREARALGTPVVAADSGDLRALSRKDPGLIVLSERRR